MDDIKVYMSSFRLNSFLKYRSYPQLINREINSLVSYATRNSDYYQMLYKNRSLFSTAILDSGAFTINNPKKKNGVTRLTFDGFKTYCKRTKDRFEFIINFDEVFEPGGIEKNHENLVELQAAGIEAIPVIHDYTGKEFDEIYRHHTIIYHSYQKICAKEDPLTQRPPWNTVHCYFLSLPKCLGRKQVLTIRLSAEPSH